jgi:hypothetical protein
MGSSSKNCRPSRWAHGTLVCSLHLLEWVHESSEELIVTTWRYRESRPCAVCEKQQEARERSEYEALSE